MGSMVNRPSRTSKLELERRAIVLVDIYLLDIHCQREPSCGGSVFEEGRGRAAPKFQICEQSSGLSIRLLILLTIGSKAKRGLAESFFQAGSARKMSHLASSSAISAKLSM